MESKTLASERLEWSALVGHCCSMKRRAVHRGKLSQHFRHFPASGYRTTVATVKEWTRSRIAMHKAAVRRFVYEQEMSRQEELEERKGCESEDDVIATQVFCPRVTCYGLSSFLCRTSLYRRWTYLQVLARPLPRRIRRYFTNLNRMVLPVIAHHYYSRVAARYAGLGIH